MHISYSEFKTWAECPYRHKLKYIDKLAPFKGNVWTAFGSALHSVCEKKLFTNSIIYRDSKNIHIGGLSRNFDEYFLKELKEIDKATVPEKKVLNDLRDSARGIIANILPTLLRYYKQFEVISTEEKIYEEAFHVAQKAAFPEIKEDWKFKGFIDLVIKTADGKYHLIDWKTCSWGWDARKKTDKMLIYQLTFYKHYYAKKYNILPENIETYFILLKRTAKHNKVEIVNITNREKRTKNALRFLEKSLYNIENNVIIKNKTSCKWCEFYKAEHNRSAECP